MALLVDGDLSRIDDLKAQDSGVLDVASGEGIDLPSKLRLAESEIGMEVELFLLWEGRGTPEQVVVDGALRRWHVLKSLEAVYRDAYFSQLNDRYEKRWQHYQELAQAQRMLGFEIGLKLVGQPLRRPQRVDVQVGDGMLPAATYWVCATYVDGAGNESAPSAVQVVSSPLPHSLTVTPLFAPAQVTGWNVYVGASAETVGKQNAAPLGVGEVWNMPAMALLVGPPPVEGQTPTMSVQRTTGRR